jgi:hypothetical protein
VFLFGQLGAGCPLVDTQEVNLSSRTGLGWKVPTWPRGELLIRGGPSLNFDDPLHPERGREHSEFLLEIQGRWPLFSKLNLEYASSAAPALRPTEHDRLNQDLLFAIPVGATGQLRLGAKHTWEDPSISKPTLEGMQLYLGLSLKH